MRSLLAVLAVVLFATMPARADVTSELLCPAAEACAVLVVDSFGDGCGDGASRRWHAVSLTTPVRVVSAAAGCGSTPEGTEYRTVDVWTTGLRGTSTGASWHSVEDPGEPQECSTTLVAEDRPRALGCPLGPPPASYPLLA